MLSFHSAVFLPFPCGLQKVVIYRTNNGLASAPRELRKPQKKALFLEDFLRGRPCGLRAGSCCGVLITLSPNTLTSKVS